MPSVDLLIRCGGVGTQVFDNEAYEGVKYEKV